MTESVNQTTTAPAQEAAAASTETVIETRDVSTGDGIISAQDEVQDTDSDGIIAMEDDGGESERTDVPEEKKETDPEDTVPEQYDFSDIKETADGGALTDEDKGFVSELGRELKLTSRQAKGLLTGGGKLLSAYRQKALQRTVDGWVADIKADKELGGSNFEETKRNCAAALKRFGTPELEKLMQSTRLSSNPDFVRFFNAIGREIREDSRFAEGRAVSKRNRLASLYPNSPFMKY